jgi:putative transposase
MVSPCFDRKHRRFQGFYEFRLVRKPLIYKEKLQTGGVPEQILGRLLNQLRRLKPSQTCPACGLQKAKTLKERTHRCANSACAYVDDRDSAAARVNLRWALGTLPKVWSEKVKKELNKSKSGAGTAPVP